MLAIIIEVKKVSVKNLAETLGTPLVQGYVREFESGSHIKQISRLMMTVSIIDVRYAK